jgi:hypothetical protein
MAGFARTASSCRAKLGTLRRLQLVEVLLFPPHRRQITCGWQAQELPVRLAALEGDEEAAVRLRHHSHDQID